MDNGNSMEKTQISLPSFSGKSSDDLTSIDQHFFILEILAKSSQWNESTKVQKLLSTLSQPILDECSSWKTDQEIRIRNNVSFHIIKELLYKKQFHEKIANKESIVLTVKEKIELRQSLVQNDDENVQEFFDRCKSVQIKLCDDFFHEELHERELLLNFLIGLKLDLQDIVLKSDAKTCNEFLEAAIKVENVHTSLKTEVIDELFSTNQEDLEEEFDDLPEQQSDQFHEKFHEIDFTENKEYLDEDKPLLDFLLNPSSTSHQNPSSEVLSDHDNNDNQNKNSGKFKCNKCGFCYTTNQLLQSHIATEHSSDKSRFTCSFCPITFHTKKFMLIHKQNNHPEKCHKCHICHQIYFSLRKLSSHHSSKHAGHENVNALKCSFCGKGMYVG